MPIKQTVPTNSGDYLQFGNATTPVAAQVGGYEDSTGNGHLELYTTASGTSTERMRIDSSGNVLVGQSSATLSPTQGFTFFPAYSSGASAGIACIGHASGTTTGTSYAIFNYNGSIIGNITQNGTTGVLYNITSDQRLKENIVDAPSALAKIDSVKVRSFDFKSDGSHVEFGTIAQELYEVAPECVAKGDNGEEIETTWGVDTSVLVPAMIKAIQELSAKVTALEAQLGAK